MKSLTPKWKHSSSMFLSLVQTMNGILLIFGLFCLTFKTSLPSIGIKTSRRTKSILFSPFERMSNASFPSLAVITLKVSSKIADKISTLISSSSTTKTVLLTKKLPRLEFEALLISLILILVYCWCGILPVISDCVFNCFIPFANIKRSISNLNGKWIFHSKGFWIVSSR